MDDPWGSPWATSDTPSRNELALPPSPPKSLLSPPPRALVGNLSPSLGHSPWADDGGFADWSRGDLTPNKNKHLTDWGTWGDSTLQQPPSASRHEGSGRASPLAWPSSTANSPGLKPLPRSRTSSIFRGSSPDPWAAEVPLNRRSTFSSFTLSLHDETGSKTDLTNDVEPPLQLDAAAVADGLTKNGIKLEEEENLSTNSDKHDPVQPHIPPINTGSRAKAPSITKSLLNEAQEASPRPSSTFSRSSGQEKDRQDSPITSIDEDAKFRPQLPSQKTSRKVQELVGIEEDISKDDTAESSPVESKLAPQDVDKNTEDDGAADFGDFEDAAQENGDPEPNATPTSAHSHRPSTPQDRAQAAVPQGSAPSSATIQSPLAEARSLAVQQLAEKFGPIRFDVDASKLDTLFPAAGESVDESRDSAGVPDRVITDSFSSISQRKAWYRISRHGSTRQHDLADDENYHRVKWSSSEVHGETLKIVRRWMEEDSYSGRAILGGSKRTSVFNWDSDAAPVDLNVVFGRKSSLHSRTSSVQKGHSATSSVHSIGQPSAPVAAPRASISSLSTNEAPPSTPVAAGFGWSSTVSDSPKAVGSAASSIKPRHSIEPPPPSRSLASTPASSVRPRVPSPIKLPQPPPSRIEQIPDDDEDDWGEMVSSPQVPTQPSIAQLVSSPAGPNPAPWQSQESLPFASNPTSPTTDPWTFADFSVFDAPAASPVAQLKPSPMPTSSEPKSPLTTQASIISAASTAPPVRSPVLRGMSSTPKSVLGPIEERTENEHERDEVVRKIVQGLPDLSYMLRDVPGPS